MSKALEIRIRVIGTKLSRTAYQTFVRIDRYDWILFTSKNAVTFFAREMRKRRIKLPQALRVAAVGPETASALRALGLPAPVVPKSFTADSMIRSMDSVRGTHILFPRSAIATPDAVRTLRARGARVRVLSLYTTTAIKLPQTTKQALLAGTYARLIFKSPSGVQGLIKQLSEKEKHIVRNIPAECIGPTTARAAKAAGFRKISDKSVL